MGKRIDVQKEGRKALEALHKEGAYLATSSLDARLRHLIYFRVSQINGAAYCMDRHYKGARALGETEQRLYGLGAWRRTPYYDDRERAAIAFAEGVTTCNVSDDVYNEAKRHFSDEEVIDLTIAVTFINAWNRIGITFSSRPGTYRVG